MPHKISYLIRNFVIGLIFFALWWFTYHAMIVKNRPEMAFNMMLLCGANTLAYPFAKAVYDKLASFFIGDNIILVNIFISALIRLFLWCVSILVAPLYLLFFIPSALKSINERG